MPLQGQNSLTACEVVLKVMGQRLLRATRRRRLAAGPGVAVQYECGSTSLSGRTIRADG